MPSRRTQLRTALAMSSAEPGEDAVRGRAAAVAHEISLPHSVNGRRVPPTGGIASVTSIGWPAPRNASRSIAGATCSPSTISP